MYRLIKFGNQEGWREKFWQLVRNLQELLLNLRFTARQEWGGSLPAALITLAVGSILLTPFLSFVSSRSLGTRAAEETFNEQYAADAGIEFGIWSILNNSTFRTQVDNPVGTPQTLTFPSPINGSTPVLTVTGIPIGNWDLREFTSAKVEKGGALAYAGGDYIYALRGDGKKDFWEYDIDNDTWDDLLDIPKKVDNGGSLVYAVDGGDDFIYALPGKSKEFWRYDIDNNLWDKMANTDKEVKEGGALAYAGGDYIYALRGDGKKDFWEYDIDNDTWDDLSDTPQNVKAGADLVAVGGYIYAFRGDKKTDFWRYDINNDTWNDTLENAPGNVDKGGALAYYSGNYIYALQGKSTGFWRYNYTMDSWTVINNAPSAVDKGGDLEFTDAEGGFAFRGGKKKDFWEFDIIPRYDISSQAGSVSTDARIKIDGLTNPILFWDIE